jgi:hypothetical protein
MSVRHTAVALLLPLLGLAATARADVFCVGRGDDTHPTLQAAVDAAAANGPEMDSIYLDSITINVPDTVVIQNQSVEIIGGYEFCQTLLAPTGISTINGGGGMTASVIEARVTNITPRDVNFDRVTITGGGNDNTGGGLHLGGSFLSVRLGPLTSLTGNFSNVGGAIFVGDARLHIDGATIANNTAASLGGGIDCVGSQVEVDAASTIRFNEARDGGGISLRGSCNLLLYGGNALSVFGNRATDKGGGMFAQGQSTIQVTRGRPTSTTPVGRDGAMSVSANQAGFRGAGIALTDTARLYAGGLVMVANNLTATPPGPIEPLGGAIFADAGTFVVIRDTARCATGESCNLIANNVINRAANSFPAGGAAIATIGADEVSVENTEITGNTINGGDATASAILVVNADHVTLSRLLFDNNGTQDGSTVRNTIELAGVGEANLSYLTIVDNAISGAGRAVLRFDDVDLLNWRSSIVDEPGDTTATFLSVTSSAIDCLLATQLASVPSPTRSFLGSASFIDRGAGDFRPALGSTQVDYCDGPVSTPGHPTLLDLDQLPVPQDAITVDIFGRYDLGAYESQQALEPPVFADGFEGS